MMMLYILDAVALAVALACMVSWLSRRKRGIHVAPYPPGPKGLPIVGNVFDMPGTDEWEKHVSGVSSDLVFIRNFGTPYLFVNSYDAAADLFEKRGHIYSTRPKNTMIELEGWAEWFTAMMPYGDELRKSRQYLHRFFQQSAIGNYHDLQTISTHKLLLKLAQDPYNFREHIRHSAAETIIMISYGYQVAENDPYVDLTDEGMEAVTQAQTFFLVNALPSLRHLPTWFPKTNFHKIAKDGYKISMSMFHEPFDKAKDEMAEGTAVPSMTNKLMESNTDEDGNVADEAIIAKAVGVAYAAGGDTTVSVLLTFLLAMVLYPEAMRKGQQELDKVIGKDNLPTFEDKPNLPYINAICTECLRWQTVTPLGVAHCAEEDDVYNGYFIPAGTTVYSNVWAMLRNSKDYPEPENFIPDRWLPSRGKEHPLNANKMAFGFGRRICPGRYFAENSVFIAIASILAVFDIQNAVDKSEVPITPSEDYTANIVRKNNSKRHPKPFKCKITPRSDKAVALIRQAGAFTK